LVIARRILARHVPQYEVWAFGSRAKGTAKEYSDLDMAIITDQPLGLSLRAAISDDFAESDLPIKVDVVDWATTNKAFQRIIEKERPSHAQRCSKPFVNAEDKPCILAFVKSPHFIRSSF